ncbi:MAG TPA: sulfite exporter TauE/SafE family protein [Actinophytocola sp.]|nr:sulfite exporter TauE/SafE family protein [Actinophytocola sp.]
MTGVLAGALGLLVGLVTGTLGGGGGVLAVPALVYALGQDARAATTGSIVIVGVISAVGVLSRLRDRVINWRTGTQFGAIGLPTGWAGAVLNRTVPQPVLLLSFAALTLAIAVLMLVRSRSASDAKASATADTCETTVLKTAPPRRAAAIRAAKVLGSGAAVGFLTGFLGVGGGFLVVPALTVVLGMAMPAAIATSLLVLTYNAISSLTARVGHLEVDWAVVGPFVAVAVLGALGGKLIADRMSAASLHRAFAALLLLVGGFVGVQSLLALL